jgi:hypothetical protein
MHPTTIRARMASDQHNGRGTMDDQPSRTSDPDAPQQPAASGSADETFGWTAEGGESAGQSGAGATAEKMISQLQAMIDQIATQAAPVVRQVGAKAAELAAAAADRAGPIAHKAADATADASVKIAERSRELAADLRRELAGGDGSTEPGTETVGGPTGTTTAVLEGVDDAVEKAAQDDPAEG